VGRTVVLHPGALGDVLLAVPALRALRAAGPEDQVILAAQPRIGALLTSLALVDSAVAFDTVGLDALFTDDDTPERLRALVAGARVVSWFGAGDATFVRRLRALAPDAVISTSTPPPGTIVWRHLLAATEPPRLDVRPIPVPLALASEGRRALTAAGWAGERRLLMIHPGAGGVAKRWPPEGFAAVAQALAERADLEIAVHDGPADHAAVVALGAQLPGPAVTLTDAPLTTLAGALAHIALWIGCDSGVSHLAAAVGAPTLALFAEANLPWRPWAEHARTRVVTMGSLAPSDVAGVVAEAISVLR
jgi:ADP-heptose:LPS heptosyltransferase